MYSQEVFGLLEAVSIQMEIPYDENQLKCSWVVRDSINRISEILKLNIFVGNNTVEYAPAINQIANYLVDNQLADGDAIEQHLKEHLLKYPLIRI